GRSPSRFPVVGRGPRPRRSDGRSGARGAGRPAAGRMHRAARERSRTSGSPPRSPRSAPRRGPLAPRAHRPRRTPARTARAAASPDAPAARPGRPRRRRAHPRPNRPRSRRCNRSRRVASGWLPAGEPRSTARALIVYCGTRRKPQVSGLFRRFPTMTFSPETLSRLVLVAIGLAALALALSALARGRPRHNQEPVVVDEILHGILDDQSNRIARLESAVRALAGTDRRQQIDIQGAVRNVGLVRYDAFEDVGGRLSFSCALLDDRGNGVVLTSINGRQETRVYAKQVTQGTSSHNLSLEEEEAIRRALGGRQAAVETG